MQAYVKGVMTSGARPASSGAGLDLLPWPTVDFARFGAIETVPLSRIRKISGANLARNWAMIPHVTQFDEADITSLEALRVALNKENEKAGVKITMLAFLIKASVFALKKFPDFNASLDGDNLVRKQYFNIGFAADTPNGLVVPVLKDADRKGVLEIAKEMGKLSRQGAPKASSDPPTCRAVLLDQLARAASAAPRSRRSSTRPRLRSSACRRAPPSPSGTATRSCRASCFRCRSPTTTA